MPVVPYSDDYDDVVNKAKRDVARNYKPEIKPLSVNLSDYDTIIIGTPTWWYKMASPVLTFMRGPTFQEKRFHKIAYRRKFQLSRIANAFALSRTVQ